MKQHSLRNFAVMRLPAWTHPALRSLEMAALTTTGSVLRFLPRNGTPPRGVVNTLQQYAAVHPEKASYKELYPAHLVVRPRPQTLPRMDSDGLVSEEGADPSSPLLHPAFVRELARTLPSAGVGVIRDGRIIASMGAVITPDNYLINEVSHTGAGDNPYSHPLFSKFRLPPVTRVDARVAVITMYPGNLPGRPYYGHWLWDILPRLHLLEKSGVAWDKLVVPQVARYERESLSLVGIDPTSVISDQDLHLQPSEVIVPSLAGFPIGNYSAWACQWLRDRFLPLTPPPSPSQPRKLYISRAKAATRRVLNEDAIMSALAPLGFERVFLEQHSFLDGVRLLRDAEAIVSAHGSNITNIVFCQPRTPVIEMFSPKWVASCHYSVACQVGLNYGYVLGQGKIRSGPGGLSENITVEPADIVNLLAAMKRKQ
jgi:Glycosyltransferase 61